MTRALTKRQVLNKNVGRISSKDGALAKKIARELAEKFAAAPRLTEATYKKPQPSKERCAKIVRLVLSDYDELNRELASLRLSTPDAFHGVFDREFWKRSTLAVGSGWSLLTT